LYWYKNEGRPITKGIPDGTMENERYAKMLNDPEGYAKI